MAHSSFPPPWHSPATGSSPAPLRSPGAFPSAARMSSQRSRPRRGSPWHPLRPRAPAPPPGSSPSHSSLSSHSLQREPLATSSPPASLRERLVLTSSSLGLLSGPFLDRASTSSAPPEVPPNSPASVPAFAPEASPTNPPLEALPFLRETQHRLHSFSDSIPDLQLQDSLAILYGQVFELRQGSEDLQFRLQLLDGKTSALLHILSTFRGTFHSTPNSAGAAEHVHAETFGRGEQVLPAKGGGFGQAMHVDREVAAVVGLHAPSPGGDTFPDARLDGGNSDADTQMEWRGTPVEEESWDEATHATWPGYKPNV